jgi:DNA-binding CsgD family transcriptional regulator
LRNIVCREERHGRQLLVGTAQDVTEQRRAEDLSAQLEVILKQLDVGVFSYTTSGERLDVNDSLVRLLECNNAADLDRPIYRQLLLGRSVAADAGLPADPGREREVSVTTPTRKERVLWIATRASKVGGKVYRIDGVVSDVTRQRRAEDQSRKAAVAAARIATLTPREREVLARVIAGEANKVIARTLELSEKTVEKHRTSIMRKTGTRNVAELVRLAVVAQGEASS